MSRVTHSVAMIGETHEAASKHLLRRDGQEDLCFGLWFPSQSRSRITALVRELVLPLPGERHVHGNASLEPAYLQRALTLATAQGAGLVLLHSHPAGRRWQGMSRDDIATESGIASNVFGATKLSLVGMTLAGDLAWSARFWTRAAPRTYERFDCGTVRVISDGLTVSYCDRLAPPPVATKEQPRTISAWGEESHKDITRLRIGLIGAGSVGGLIGDTLARSGFEDVMSIDFDGIETHNLDRLTYATRKDVGSLKVDVQALHLAEIATANPFRPEPISSAVYEEAAFRAALDCDVLFSCVDRPWGRYVLNTIAYAHLIPVIDGGILARTNRFDRIVAADWTALTAMPGRQCLECAGQYDMNFVQMEREGLLDDPTYIENLPKGHPLRARENVFGFSMSCASLQFLQMLALVLSPLGQPNPGRQIYHFVGNCMESPQYHDCAEDCRFLNCIGKGDAAGFAETSMPFTA
jgi:molybdopterin-synthase adenylyltransferase